MKEQSVVVQLESGLHARPASEFVSAAQRFSSHISLQVGNKTVDGKSILGILSLAIAKGTQVLVKADGQDEEEAVRTLTAILTSTL
ncbi:phosphocarrier protein HPr [Alicyclobacillus hesperidum]|uniref:Phosphocarrier protein HPr n=1 Tax=Alicyclobacillus hesperidum TaxID=89784 RepID=A0A1H2SPV4_9BACL|nr:HPr family phosphocarrier protein [Alicyclobacillus hesperidum]GLV12461.1 phosphocarrier protein HPr [Alicyclobacillus hesperidum]GLV12469.1 phosphocarrier protein HPr [Alicyclobacillus hesperidum]SDW33079.1 catabolite repression HPr-like protein [Alicyclobacillus hesperidum]